MPFDPFSQLAGQAVKVGTDIWTAIMLSVWNVGLLLMRFVLGLEEHFLTPDLSESGPARDLYATTFWIAAGLLVIMIMVQLGVAALRRDGKSLGRLLLGVGQFVMVWAAWLTYAAAVIAACSGLNAALMRTLFATDSLAGWDPLGGFEVGDVTEVVTAGVLGLLGVLLCVAAIAHFVVLLTRAGALVVLAATTPISAAGLVGDTGRSWFWKSLRWFHAAAFTPVVMTLIMGVGVQMASGVAGGQADRTNEAIGTALPAVVLMLIAAVSPLALFKLLAFVDPGTNSGASVRMGLGALGGVSGLLGGQRGGGDAGTATQTAASGRSQGEAQGEDATNRRFAAGQAAGTGGSGSPAGTAAGAGAGGGMAGAAAGVAGAAGAAGVAGMAVAAGVRGLASIGGSAAAVATDTTNQMGVGHNTYQPEFSGSGRSGGQNSQPGDTDSSGQPTADQPTPDDSSRMPQPSTPGGPAAPPSPGGPGAAGSAGGTGGSAGEAGGSEAATAARAAAVAVV